MFDVPSRSRRAFTMVEIALCLAIIGFGLVAIIGVLPTGLNVQKANREETIIDQDAVVWMSAIRNGAQGCDDLTNYVIGITNYWSQYDANTNLIGAPGIDGYDFKGSDVTSIAPKPFFPITNGLRIVGLLSTPKITLLGNGFQSNYVVATVRAFSGVAIEKYPQDQPEILENAFGYRMIAEMIPYVPYDWYATNYAYVSTNDAVARLRLLHQQQNNSHDLRLTFRWPLMPNGGAGNGRLTFRLFTGGRIILTNDFTSSVPPNHPLYFLDPSVYEQAYR
jgi:type II secretory pathway pseudopilin PulG